MRTMAIDYGDQRIGLAVSDPLGLLAGEAWTMQEWDMARAARRIAEEARARDVGTLVLGLPKNMDGTEGPRAEKSRAFRELLIRECGLPVILWDERRSSIEAHAILHSAGKREKQHRKTVDAVAASLILGAGSAAQNKRVRQRRKPAKLPYPVFVFRAERGDSRPISLFVLPKRETVLGLQREKGACALDVVRARPLSHAAGRNRASDLKDDALVAIPSAPGALPGLRDVDFSRGSGRLL